MFLGSRFLRLHCTEVIEGRSGETRVVAEAVTVSDCGGELFAEWGCLHHLQAHTAQREIAGEIASQSAECRSGADDHEIGVEAATVVVADVCAGGGRRDLAGFRSGVEGVTAGGFEVRTDGGERLP